jgi:hypothetical protein
MRPVEEIVRDETLHRIADLRKRNAPNAGYLVRQVSSEAMAGETRNSMVSSDYRGGLRSGIGSFVIEENGFIPESIAKISCQNTFGSSATTFRYMDVYPNKALIHTHNGGYLTDNIARTAVLKQLAALDQSISVSSANYSRGYTLL